MRGSLFQMFPIGCMRVFITPSCSSVVMRFSLWDALANAVSFALAPNWRIWLRARTSSPTRFMSWSRRPTSTRMLVSACRASRCEGVSPSTEEGPSPDGGIANALLEGGALADAGGAGAAVAATGSAVVT